MTDEREKNRQVMADLVTSAICWNCISSRPPHDYRPGETLEGELKRDPSKREPIRNLRSDDIAVVRPKSPEPRRKRSRVYSFK